MMKKQIITYSVLAYAISWVLALWIYLQISRGNWSGDQVNLFHSWVALGPVLAALITTYWYYRKSGLKKLGQKLRLRLPDGNTLLIVLSPLLFFAIGLLIYRLVEKDWYSFSAFSENNWSSTPAFLGWLLPLFTYAIFEEIGWRGFLLPHLQEKYTAWTATIFLAVIWALWHIPFFFYRFDFSLFISVGFFFGIFVGALLLTSIYNSGKGFLLPVILFHFFNNLSSMFDKETIAAVLSTGFVFLAIYVYRKFGRQNLSSTERTKNYFDWQGAGR